jgi:hypothetical protein
MTTTTPKADRYSDRAPRGGAISPIIGQWYAGGQWMRMTAEVVEVSAKTAPLAGRTRQVAWANRLRTQALATLRTRSTPGCCSSRARSRRKRPRTARRSGRS